MSVLVLISEKDSGAAGKNNAEVVVKTGVVTVECVRVKGAEEAAPDCGGPSPYGKTKVSVDVVCEVGSKPRRSWAVAMLF